MQGAISAGLFDWGVEPAVSHVATCPRAPCAEWVHGWGATEKLASFLAQFVCTLPKTVFRCCCVCSPSTYHVPSQYNTIQKKTTTKTKKGFDSFHLIEREHFRGFSHRRPALSLSLSLSLSLHPHTWSKTPWMNDICTVQIYNYELCRAKLSPSHCEERERFFFRRINYYYYSTAQGDDDNISPLPSRGDAWFNGKPNPRVFWVKIFPFLSFSCL